MPRRYTFPARPSDLKNVILRFVLTCTSKTCMPIIYFYKGTYYARIILTKKVCLLLLCSKLCYSNPYIVPTPPHYNYIKSSKESADCEADIYVTIILTIKSSKE